MTAAIRGAITVEENDREQIYEATSEMMQQIIELNNIKKEKQNALKEILEGDPRPAYHEDGRQYGFAFAGKEIKFTVTDNTLTVTEITDGK